MRGARSTFLLFFTLLAFGVCCTIPAEDVVETAYDESESLPYEPAAGISAAPSQATFEVIRVRPIHHPTKLCTLLRVICFRNRDSDARHTIEKPGTLLLLCTLLC